MEKNEYPCEDCAEMVSVDDFCGDDKEDGASEYLCGDCYSARRELKTKDLVEAVKAHATKNYETNGWSYIVEAWSDEDLFEQLDGKDHTILSAIEDMFTFADIWYDRFLEAQSHREW